MHYFSMAPEAPLFEPEMLEQLARIIDRARYGNGIRTQVQYAQLSADLACLFREASEMEEPNNGSGSTPWDRIAEEAPTPVRRYKIFAKALASDDPLTTLRTLSQGRSPSEIYLLGTRIKSYARSRLRVMERSLPDLRTAKWADLNDEQQATVRKHMSHLNVYYCRTQARNTDPMENRINLAVHALAELFARQTHFDRMPTDLPCTATSRLVQFLCLALRPIAHPNKLSPDAVSMRWRRIKGPSDIHQD